MAKVMLDKNGQAKSAGTLTIYNFDAISGEFTGCSDEFLVQGVGLPANACLTAPPATKAGRVALYCNGSWLDVADHRGETVYSTTDGTAQLVTGLGDYPVGTTTLAPATVFDKWDGDKWVTDAEAQRATAILEIEREKIARIGEANSITQAWQTQLQLNMITDEDKASLIAWMKYINILQAINAPEMNIIWPEKPS
ncbi:MULTISPECIES: tail fiber assembly protein [unclassified Pantoea]|uniref:tail fiber assembly protein n=1 Tax=unclassified Pantoea TaxID=2630326 RepID=UPI00226996DD|nr:MULTISPECIES: tail fiber assembly protein [unclassified Pantoea]